MPSTVQFQPFRDYNALVYGAAPGTDSTTSIQDAINAANTAGGGRVIIPGYGQSTPYYISSPLTLYSNVTLAGTGFGNTVIQLLANSNCDMVTSYQFNSLIGTNSTGGVSNCAIQDITLDGNSANQSSGTGRILSIYGYYYTIENCVFRFAYGQLMYSEWATSGTAPNPDSMEARIRNCKFHNAANDSGLVFNGPHDSIITDLEVYRTKYHGVQVGPNAGGTKFVNVHPWSQNVSNSACNWLIEANNIQCMNCYADASDTVGVVLLGTSIEWLGGLVAGNLSFPATGIQFGQSAGNTPYHGSYNQSAGLTTAVTATQPLVQTMVTNWTGAHGALWFPNISTGLIQAIITPGAGGSTWTGTLDGATQIFWLSSGVSGATNSNVLKMTGLYVEGHSGTQTIANNGQITTGSSSSQYVTTAGNVTGVILQTGAYTSQVVSVVNTSANTLTFDVAATSHVAGSTGSNIVIQPTSFHRFLWDGSSLWYPHA